MFYDCLNSEEKMKQLKQERDKQVSRRVDVLAMVTMFALGIAVGMVLIVTVKAIEKKMQPQAKCIVCHNIKAHPPEQLLTYKSYRLFHSKLIREI